LVQKFSTNPEEGSVGLHWIRKSLGANMGRPVSVPELEVDGTGPFPGEPQISPDRDGKTKELCIQETVSLRPWGYILLKCMLG
jgi:hypothetical protein